MSSFTQPRQGPFPSIDLHRAVQVSMPRRSRNRTVALFFLNGRHRDRDTMRLIERAKTNSGPSDQSRSSRHDGLAKRPSTISRALGIATSHCAKLGKRQSPQTRTRNRSEIPQSLALAIAEETLPPAMNQRRRGRSMAKFRSSARRESALVGSSRASVDRNRRAAQPMHIRAQSLFHTLVRCKHALIGSPALVGNCVKTMAGVTASIFPPFHRIYNPP